MITIVKWQIWKYIVYLKYDHTLDRSILFRTYLQYHLIFYLSNFLDDSQLLFSRLLIIFDIFYISFYLKLSYFVRIHRQEIMNAKLYSSNRYTNFY